MSTDVTPGGFSLDISKYLTPVQFEADGSVYGVRPLDMAAKAPSGNGTYEIMGKSSTAFTTITPGACASSGNFPGGWCNTAHAIAASAFGWDFHVGGAGVIIGMVDTGIDLNHTEFAGRVLPGHCVTSSVNPCTSADDVLGGDDAVFPAAADATHGTHTAGIAAGANVGIAYLASILPVKVCGSNVDSCQGVDDGIVWAAQHGASVVSVSIGGPVLAASDVTAFQTAVSAGALIVVAAGNSGNKDPASGFLSGGALDDGVRGSMIVVGATGCNGPNPSVPANCANGGKGGIASFSQEPSTRCEVHDGARFCLKDFFVVAPGVDIWSSVGNGPSATALYGYLSGTSMATPFVSGVAAVIKGMWPTLTSSQIASVIFQTTDDMGAVGVDPVYGRGAVDITKALGPAGATIVANHSFSVGGSNSMTAGMTPSSATTATLSSLGASNATTSLVSGALSVAVRNSTVLKSAIVIDSFGRTFHADLTQSTYNPGLDFSNYFMAQGFSTLSPFAVSMQGPLGNFEASGYAVDTVTPRLLSGQLRTTDHTDMAVRDLELSAPIAEGVELNMGYNLDLSGRFNGYDLQASSAYDGLFLSGSALNSPYASLTSGGDFVGTTVTVADNLHLHVGQSMLQAQHGEYEVPVFSYLTQLVGPQQNISQRTAQSSLVSADWDFASWGGLGLTASNTNEQNGLLGGFNSGALAMASNANTSAVGLSGRVGFGDGWVTTVSYSEGITQLDMKSTSLLSDADTLHSRSYGIAVAKHGLFGDNDSLGVAVSRPVQIYAGGVGITAATSVDDNGNLVTSSEHVSLASQTPETDLEMGYVTSFFNGALSLQANAAYQMNLAGQSGTNSLAVLSRAKINF